MTAIEKANAFNTVRKQVRAIEERYKHQAIADQAHNQVAAYVAVLEARRDQARKFGGFSVLR